MKHSRITATLIAAAIAASATIALSADTDTGRTRTFKYVMGTAMRVEVYGGDAAARQQATDESFAALAEVDRMMSRYRADSELTRVNNAAGTRPVEISAPLFAVLDAAERVRRLSGGTFDVRRYSLATPSGGPTSQSRVRSHSELASSNAPTDVPGLELNAQARTVHFSRTGMTIDLDGIAKGFAAEIAASGLKRRGLAGVVDAGGQQFMVGLPPGKQWWSVGIQHPDRPGTLLGALDIQGGAVSTTAVGPASRTGQTSPACVSATVVSPDGTLAQALSHAACILGPTQGLALLDRFPETWGVIAYRGSDGTAAVRTSARHVRDFHPNARD